MDLECIVIGTCCLYSHIGRHLDNIYAFEIWHEVMSISGMDVSSILLSFLSCCEMPGVIF
jgi:hypothetical protein